MANRFWVGGNSVWNGTAGSKWSTSSGGPGGASVPASGDTVYINSGSVTLGYNTPAVLNVVVGYGATLNLSSYTLNAGELMNMGTVNFNTGKALLGYSYYADFATTNMNSGICEIQGTATSVANKFYTSGGTFNAGTGLIVLNVNNNDQGNFLFETNGKTFNDVIINFGNVNSGGYSMDVTGSPTFRLLDIRSANSAAHTVNFDSAVQVSKLIAIGSSSSSKLSLTGGSGSGRIGISDTGTSYGQFVHVDVLGDPTSLAKYYIGSNSTRGANAPSNHWLLQDPTKISTLVDPLTTALGSNPNWTTSGTVTQVTSGHDGGGYQLASGATITSTDTFDLTDSEIVLEFPTTVTSGILRYTLAEMLPNIFGELHSSFVDVGFNNYEYSISSTTGAPKYVRIKVSSVGVISGQFSDNGTSWSSFETLATYPSDKLLLLKSNRIKVTSTGGTSVLGSINPSFNTPPTTTLNSPANSAILATTTPTLAFTATDPDGDDVSYQVQVSTSSSFTTTHMDVTTATFPSGTQQTRVVSPALTQGDIDYYWRVRAKDASGSNEWGNWSATRTMVVDSNYVGETYINQSTNPSFERALNPGTVEIRRNFDTNPRFQGTGAFPTGWTTYQGTGTTVVGSRSLNDGVETVSVTSFSGGVMRYGITKNAFSLIGALTADTDVTFSIDVTSLTLNSGATGQLYIEARRPGNIYVNNTTDFSSTGRKYVTLSVPQDAESLNVYVWVRSPVAGVINSTLEFKSSMIERIGAELPYFDGSTNDGFMSAVPSWTGTADNSQSILSSGTLTEVRRNLATNPSSEVSVMAYQGGGGATTSRSSDWAKYGTYSSKAVNTTNDTNSRFFLNIEHATTPLRGRTFTVTATCNKTETTITGDRTPRILIVISRTDPVQYQALYGEKLPDAAGEYTTSFTFTVPDETRIDRIEVGLCTGGQTGSVVYWDGLLVEEIGTALPYFDGSTNNDFDKNSLMPQWTGAANDSESVLRGVAPVGAFRWNSTLTPAMWLSTDGANHGSKFVRYLFKQSSPSTIAHTDVVDVPPLIERTNYITIRSSRPQVAQPRWQNAAGGGGGSIIAGGTVALSNSWQEVKRTGSPNLINSPLDFLLNNVQVGDIIDIDNHYVVKGGYTGEYFDGDSVYGEWEGAANNSTSRYTPLPKISTLVQDFSDVSKYDPNLWSTFSTGTGSASVGDGSIYTYISGGSSSMATVESAQRYDMRDSEVILDLWQSPGANITFGSDYGYLNNPFSGGAAAIAEGIKKAKYDTSTKTMTIWDFDSGVWNLEYTIPNPFMGDPGLDQDLAASSVSIRVSSSTASNTMNNASVYSINVDPETPGQGNFLLFF